MFERKKFKNIINLGDHCSSAFLLTFFKLRKNSQPFDWIIAYTPESKGAEHFSRVLNILINRFDGFFEKEDFVLDENNSDKFHYLNKRTGFVFMHDFSIDKPFENFFEKVKEKYIKRSKRVLKFLDSRGCKNLLLFCDNNNRNFGIDEVKKNAVSAFEDFKKHFDSDLSLVYFFDNHQEYFFECFEVQEVSKDVIFVNYSQNLNSFIKFYSRYYSLKNFLDSYIKNSKIQSIVTILTTYIINIVPFKKMRRNLRNKYRRIRFGIMHEEC